MMTHCHVYVTFANVCVRTKEQIAEQSVTLLTSLLSCAGKSCVSIWPREAVNKKLS